MSKLRVLIAGDSDLLNSVLKTSLSCWGYEVITVQDGEQACLALCVGNIDLCIMSTDIPRVSGLEVCKFIRQTDVTNPAFCDSAHPKRYPQNACGPHIWRAQMIS